MATRVNIPLDPPFPDRVASEGLEIDLVSARFVVAHHAKVYRYYGVLVVRALLEDDREGFARWKAGMGRLRAAYERACAVLGVEPAPTYADMEDD